MFKKAVKSQAKLKLALTGPSGSGKTYSSLVLATSLGKKIAFIDTENGSASLYSDLFSFDVLDLSPPYTTDKYIKAIDAAVGAGYDVLIIDSLSHAWAGEGGLLQKKESLDARGGNQFANWRPITKEQETLVAKVLHSKIHTICAMRSKQEYVIEEKDGKRSAPKKVGMAPIQREGLEYEFTVVFDLGMSHEFVASKDRTGLFDGVVEKISKRTAETLKDWLSSGAAEVQKNDAPLPQPEPFSEPPIEDQPELPTYPPAFNADEPMPEFDPPKSYDPYVRKVEAKPEPTPEPKDQPAFGNGDKITAAIAQKLAKLGKSKGFDQPLMNSIVKKFTTKTKWSELTCAEADFVSSVFNTTKPDDHKGKP